MKKHRKMSEKTCFLTSCTFTAASVLTAVLLICLYFLSPKTEMQGMGGVITFYAISAAKMAVLCFLSAVTLFLSLLSLVFSVKTAVDNLGTVRIMGIMLTALNASSAAFGAFVLFCFGVIDDLWGLRYRTKFIGQIVAFQAVDPGDIIGRLPVLDPDRPLLVLKDSLHAFAVKLVIKNLHDISPFL